MIDLGSGDLLLLVQVNIVKNIKNFLLFLRVFSCRDFFFLYVLCFKDSFSFFFVLQESKRFRLDYVD